MATVIDSVRQAKASRGEKADVHELPKKKAAKKTTAKKATKKPAARRPPSA